MIVYVYANVKNRFEWAKARARDKGEAEMTWTEFLLQDNAENEIHVDEIGLRADLKILNTGTRDEYLEKIAGLYNEKLKPLLLGA